MHLSYRYAVVFSNHIHHLLQAEFPTFVTMRVKSGIGTKRAGKHAHVPRLDIEIPFDLFISKSKVEYSL